MSERLQQRIERDFREFGSAAEAIRLVGEADDSERVQAAIVFVASGDVGRLRDAIALARTDWRDVLVAGELADDDWQPRLDELLSRAPYLPIFAGHNCARAGNLCGVCARCTVLV